MSHQIEITRLVKEIISSETFSKSQHSKHLLEYLAKATIEKKDIKEYTVAKEVFNKESDTGVRAYIHNLRKKLDEYYETEGKNSKFILSIPKGQYHVQVAERKKESAKATAPNLRFLFKKKFILFVVGLLILSLTIFYVNKGQSRQPEDSFVWGDIIKSEHPLLIVVGDHYFFQSGIITGNSGIVRDFNINSEEELENWIKNKSQSIKDSIQKIKYSYTTKQGPLSVFQISPYIKRDQNVQLILSSELTYEQIKNHNILFLGKYATMGILRSLIENKYINEDRHNNKLQYIQKDTVINLKIMLGPSYKEDYPVVLKFKTPYKKTILMFMSGDDPGNAAVIDYFLDNKNIAWIEKELGLSEKENSFSALFKAVGLGRTDYSIEYITGERIEND
jgi:hypothetical protein